MYGFLDFCMDHYGFVWIVGVCMDTMSLYEFFDFCISISCSIYRV